MFIRSHSKDSCVSLPLLLQMGVCALAFTMTGCSGKGDHLPVNHVKGTLFINDKPAPGAKVVLHPWSNPSFPPGLRPSAEVGADGSFEISTYGTGDGAPAGDYIITVSWPMPKDDPQDEFPPDRLKNAYSDPRSAKFRAQIKPGENELPPLKIP